MENNKENKKLNNLESNDFEYEALLKSEGEKINNAKYDFQSVPNGFQESLKMKILEKRRGKSDNMKKIFEILSIPIQPKYSVSFITIAVLLFVGANILSVPEGDYFSYNIIEKIAKVKDNVFNIGGDNKNKIDDWQYTAESGREGGILSPLYNAVGGARSKSAAVPSAPGAYMESDSNIGLSVGGAKDINNFRENIKNNYLPLSTDITYEGLFYDYYFDTAQEKQCNKLFCPSYTYAVSDDPFSKNPEYYLSVGLNSGIKESDFQRKKLNLVVVLDISGSMSSSFDRYYYDRFGNQIEVKEGDFGKTKMEIANESVVSLLSHLNSDDRFGMVVFSTNAYLAKPLSKVGDTDMEKIKDHILEIKATDSTNMEAGMKMGTDLFKEFLNADQNEYENRIIFLTDAMPNTGDFSEGGLFGITKDNSEDKLYSTFIGIGVDFNTELIEAITKIRGANYYSVHSSTEFKKRLDDEFEYMVTPLVFNLALKLEANGYKIEKVYGSPEANEATGEIMKVNTLFPSKTEGGETKGGLVLIKLKKISPKASLKIKTTYEDRNGEVDGDEADININRSAEYFGSNGIRKGIVLVRYASLVKDWINDERNYYQEPKPITPCINREIGIVDCYPEPYLNQWERQSIDLRVSGGYKSLFNDFKVYFEKEMNVIDDEIMEQEMDILEKLINY